MGWRVLAMGGVVALVTTVFGPVAASAGTEVVRTPDGAVRGVIHPDYRQFLGIPYAAPPVGELRWRAPEAVRPWRGTLDATAERSPCAQLSLFGFPETHSEDCLYLNVSVPRRVRAGLPVMVWFHGGNFTAGSGALYDGRRLAAEGDVVVVTVNYRLGPLGFLALPALSAEKPGVQSGNYAIEDQQAALRWVRRSIAAFGGDPHNVTIFGESAGAGEVCVHLVSPQSAGLFQKAAAQSGSCTWKLATGPEAESTGTAMAAQLGCTDPATAADCLRAKPAVDLLHAWPGGTPVIGGREVPVQLAEALRTDRFHHVPLLLGNTRDEKRLEVSLTHDAAGAPVTAASYPEIIRATYGSDADRVLARYPLSAYPTPSIALASVFSDVSPPVGTCEQLAGYRVVTARPHPVPLHVYQFADRTAPPLADIPGFDEGAEHATDLNYLFPQVFGPPLNAGQQTLADIMVKYWANFARTGDPNGRGLPYWPRFRGPDDVLSLNQGDIHTVDISAASNCDFWATVLTR